MNLAPPALVPPSATARAGRSALVALSLTAAQVNPPGRGGVGGSGTGLHVRKQLSLLSVPIDFGMAAPPLHW